MDTQRHINKIEAIVPAICCSIWGAYLKGCLWLHFIDNDGALACLIAGHSKSTILSEIIDYTWEQVPALQCWPWFERVPSQCNIVDGLSRGNFSAAVGWTRDVPILPRELSALRA